MLAFHRLGPDIQNGLLHNRDFDSSNRCRLGLIVWWKDTVLFHDQGTLRVRICGGPNLDPIAVDYPAHPSIRIAR